jgi:hypothetical protein
MCRVPQVRAVSPPRIELSSILAAGPLRPPARPPPSGRRDGRAVQPRVRPAPCVRPGAGVASPRGLDSHARLCAWRPRVAAQVQSEWDQGKELRDGAIPWVPPGAYLHVCHGARVAASMRDCILRAALFAEVDRVAVAVRAL